MGTCHIQFTCESQIRELTRLRKSWWVHIILEDVIFPKKCCNGPHNRCVNIWTKIIHMETQLLACKYRLAKDLGESKWIWTKRWEAATICVLNDGCMIESLSLLLSGTIVVWIYGRGQFISMARKYRLARDLGESIDTGGCMPTFCFVNDGWIIISHPCLVTIEAEK